ncbi:MAG: ABC transporter substrate-binding subunit SaoX [Syntrophomonas sp.]
MGKKFRLFTVLALITVMLAMVLAGCGTGKKDTAATSPTAKKTDNYVVNIGYYNCDHMVGACVAKEAGIYKDLGINVKITGNGQVPEAMAAAKMDVGYVGTDSVMFGYMKGSPIFVAADNHDGGSYYLVASNKVKNAQDLIGKKVALGTDAEKNNPCWVQMAAKLSIPADSKKYQNFDMDDKDKYLALKTGHLDGYLCCDPWGSMAEYEKTGHIMAVWNGLPDGQAGTCCVLGMRRGFADEHPDLAKKMVLAHTQALEYVYLHPVKASKIFAKTYGMPEEVALMTVYKKTVQEGRSLTWKIKPDRIKANYEVNKNTAGLTDYATYAPLDKWVDTTLLSQCGADDFDTFIKEKVDPVFPVGMPYEQWKQKALEIDD